MDSRRRMFTEGLVAGLIGYVTIAAFFAVMNLALGRPMLATARALGEGLVAPGMAESVPLAPVFVGNAVHLGALLIVGLAAAWLVDETERHPQLWLVTLLVGLLGLFFSEILFLTLASTGLATLPFWSVMAANLLAGLTVGGFLLGAHRRLLRRVQELGVDAV